MSRPKTINVRDIYMVEGQIENGQPVLVFSSAKHRVRVHFSDFMVGSIGQRLQEHLNARQRTIDHARQKLRGEA